MGLAAMGALIFVTLALIGQSPSLMRRLGLDVYRLDLRVRAFTGYAFACLLLIAGFFLAGVPLGDANAEPVAQNEEPQPTATGVAETAGMSEAMTRSAGNALTTTLAATGVVTPTDDRPASGAFGGVPTPGSETPAGETDVATPVIPTPTDEGAAEEEGTTVATATGTPTPVSTDTPTPTWTPSPTLTPSSTPTPTPTPTATPTPSLTPTPIEGETAVVDADGANVWLYRSPGGQELVLVSHGDTVILLSRRANQGGVLWREVMTLQGLSGWLQAQYLPEP